MANGWPKPIITVLRICPQKTHFSLVGFRGSLQPVEKSEFSLRKKNQWLQALIMATPLTIG
jgi:hypothetical protein